MNIAIPYLILIIDTGKLKDNILQTTNINEELFYLFV